MKLRGTLYKPEIWVVDPEPISRARLCAFLRSHGFTEVFYESAEEAVRAESLGDRPSPSLLILDFHVSPSGSADLLRHFARRSRRIPVIVLSSDGQVSDVVAAMQLGAFDFLVKPLDEAKLDAAMKRALKDHSVTGTVCPVLDTNSPVATLSTGNQRMLQILLICDQVAPTDVPVLILGESGVGKEVLARYLHARSGRRDAFLKVNCAALPADLLESELFGHERGAFTGAQREKPGKFELAGQGTIMMDEISEMSSLLQSKLLHVLQDGEYSRLGSTRSLKCQARVIAATNRRLHTLVECGEFREDLYFRLNVVTIEVPPLRERPEDIRQLCEYFVELYRVKYNSSVESLPEELLDAFSRYRWPGNIRQLENTIRRFLILPDVSQVLGSLDHGATPGDLPAPRMLESTTGLSLKAFSVGATEKAEKDIILRTLDEVNWNRKQAARRLNIGYKSLLVKLRRWKLGRQTTQEVAGDRKPPMRKTTREAKEATGPEPLQTRRSAASGQ